MAAMLDRNGMIVAIVMGIIIFLTAEWTYLALLCLFLFLGVVVTRYGYKEKKDMGIYEHERSLENVLSNGIAPMFFAILSPIIGPLPYIASVAAIMADKFASELGVLAEEKPLSLATLKPVKPGTSGGVTVFGSVMSLAGAVAIGTAAIFLFNITPTVAVLVGFTGFLGSVVDSLFGVLEEMGIGTKGTTNFICSLVGGIVGFYIGR